MDLCFETIFLSIGCIENDVSGRNGYPLGDENFKGELLKVDTL